MDPREVLFPAGIAAGAAAAETLVLLSGTRSYVHMGSRSHDSLAVGERTGRVLDAMMTPYTDPSGWGATHIDGHHRLADANVQPFIEIADYLDWRSQNSSIGHPDLPEEFNNLDYVARGIKLSDVYDVGTVAREVAEEAGYTPQESYTPEEARQILTTRHNRFAYRNMKDRARRPTPSEWPDDKVVGLEDIWFKLMDPHSPSLHPRGPKPLPFFKDMIPLMYRSVERNYDSNESLPDYAQRDELQQWNYEHRKQVIRGVVTAHALAGAAIGAFMGERTIPRIAKNAAVGAAVVGLSGAGLIAGGTLTNYFGHLGKDPIRAFKTGEITPHDDGSLATNGNILLSLVTLDEAGWQGNHHNHPEWIDFGNGRPLQAPIGFILKRFVDSGALGLGHGEHFGSPEHRPDELHESVRMIQSLRVRTIQNKPSAHTA